MNTMIQLPIEQASDEQLLAYAESLDLTPKDKKRATLLALLAGPAWGKPFILVAKPPEQSDDQRAIVVHEADQRLEGGIGSDDPKVLLTIGKTQQPGGAHPASVSHNGKAMVIQRGIKVEVPYRYYLALLDARCADVQQDPNTKEITESEITNYPLQVHAMPSQEEIAAWFKRTENELMPA